MQVLKALNDIVRSSLDPREVLERVVEAAVSLLEAEAACVWLVDHEATRLRRAATRCSETTPPGATELPLDDPFVAQMLALRAPRDTATSGTHPFLDCGEPRASGEPVVRVIVPLTVGDRALGVLAVVAKAGQVFSGDDHELLVLLAQQAAMAVESARLSAETGHRLRQTETLLNVGRAVTSTLDFIEAMRRVARETGRALGADMVGAYRVDEEGESLHPVAGYHVPSSMLERFMKFPIHIRTNDYIREAWRTLQPTWCPDARVNPGTEPELVAWVPMRSVIFFPLAVKQRPIGGLFLIWWTTRPAATATELALLEGIARQTALALGNAWLFEGRDRDAQRLEALTTVSRRLGSVRDPRELFAMITTYAADLLGARVARLWIFDAAAGDLAMVSATGDGVEAEPGLGEQRRLKPGTGLVGTIFQSKQTEFVVDITGDPRLENRELILRHGLRGFAGVPLIVKDEVLGVLAVLTQRRGNFASSHRSLLEAFASEAALALHNARLFVELERRLTESEALLGMADAFGKTQDVGEIMRRVCREATRAVGADSAVFYTVSDDGSVVVPAAGYHIPKAVLDHARPIALEEVPRRFVDTVRTKEITFVADVSAVGVIEPTLVDAKLRSLLTSPVWSGERVFGILVFYWWDRVYEPDAAVFTLVGALSAQAALVLENGRLLAEARSHAAALEEKNAELDSFVYTVSHDLKSPLVTIQGMATLALEDVGDGMDPLTRRYLERIQANTQHMEHLLLDLLALSRIGREARDAEDVALEDVVDEILSELGGPLRQRGITVDVGDLPRVPAIRVQMEQVWRNLLTNAVKYIGDAPAPAIEVGAVDHGAVVECWVRDTGIGIDRAYHDKIFEVFQRLKEVEAEGTGVGLAIVKKIVDGAGGRLWVESAPGAGATFRFTWPTGPRR